jgi:endoglucanase
MTSSLSIWRDAAQVAVTAIRATGATNYILLPGNGFSGAWSWFLGFYDKGAVNAQSNAQLMPSVTDSLNKMIYEVHQYFDSNKSGTSTTCLNAPVGNSTLADFTFWLRENKKRAFLGEFGVANNANCLQALKDAVKHMHDNSDVWYSLHDNIHNSDTNFCYLVGLDGLTGQEVRSKNLKFDWIHSTRTKFVFYL